MSGEAWAKVFARYYTPDDMANWEKAKAQFSPEDRDGYGARWREVIARVEAARSRGVAPDAPETIDLAQAWLELQRPLVEAVGTATWGKAATMYQQMDDWRAAGAEPPFSKADYDYVGQAAEAGRAAGVIPPRAPTPA